MSNNGKANQNGGLPTMNNATNVLGRDKVCRDYVWGRCIRKQCELPHECDIQTMLDILQFCHDFQNSSGCKRQKCTFLHASREEEKLFRELGQYPSDLKKRHSKMNMLRDEAYTNQPPPPSTQGPPPTPRQGTLIPSYQGPPPVVPQGAMLSVNPASQLPWCLLPPPPPPREPSPPQSYLGTTVNGSSPSTSYIDTVAARIDTSKPLPQHLKNGSLRRQTDEEGHLKAAQSNYPQPTQEILKIDITKPPPRLPTRNIICERPLQDYAGPSKSRKIDTESTTCENCLQWDLRNLEIEKKKKDKLKEKGILVLQYEEKKKEIADIVDTLKGLHNDNSNKESFDLASMDLRYALNDHDILRSKGLDESEFLSRSQSTKPVASSSGLGPVTSSAPMPPPSGPPGPPAAAYSQPPPARPHFPLAPPYLQPAPHLTQYFPGPSSSSPVNNFSIPPPALPPSQPPYDPNYYNMMGRPPPSFT